MKLSRYFLLNLVGSLLAAFITVKACNDSHPKTNLTITVDERMESFDWVVTCDPVGGDHPHPEIVCAELEQLQVSLQEAFQAEPQGACVLIYMPTNLTIFGTLNGHMTEFKDEYSNSCILNRTLTAAGLPGLVPFNEDGTYNTVKH